MLCALQALKTLFYVPRFRGHTILQPLKAKYGRVLLYAWPKSSHGGVVANNLMSSICRLAGITNIGIKVKLPDGMQPFVHGCTGAQDQAAGPVCVQALYNLKL